MSGPPTNLSALNVMGVPTMGGAGGFPYPIPASPNTYFVSSVTGSNGNEGNSMDAPFATVAYVMDNKAIARSANNPAGTVIVALPGHLETFSSSTACVCDIVGVTVIGLGVGTQRPLFTLGTANTTTIGVTADGVSWINCQFKANFLSIAACFVLTTAKNFTLLGNYFYEASSVLNFLNIVKTTGAANTADGLTCINNSWSSLGVTTVRSFILSADAMADVILQWNKVKLARTTTDAILMTVTTGVLANLDCGYNKVYSAATATTGGGLINVGGTTSTGWVYNNYQQTLGTATDILYTTTVGLAAFNNYVTGVVGASGFLIPAVDT